MTTAKFERFIPVILKHEGGYVNDPVDPGGETNYGISKRSYPNLDIRNLSVDQAKEIYFNDFYKKFRIEDIKDEDTSLQLFDFGVNAGGNAVKVMQRILGLKDDGVIGNDTLTAINSYSNPAKLHNLFVDARVKYYNDLAARKPAMSKYINGWVSRVLNTTTKKKIAAFSIGAVVFGTGLFFLGRFLIKRYTKLME